MIRYNILYQSLKKVSGDWHAGHVQWYYYWDYLMFFEDGSVIEASINSDGCQKINKGFSKENKDVIHGSFICNEKEIHIEIDGKAISGGSTFDNKLILMKDNRSWDMFTPID